MTVESDIVSVGASTTFPRQGFGFEFYLEHPQPLAYPVIKKRKKAVK